MSSPRTAKMFPLKSVMTFRRGSVQLWRKRNARMFQELNAPMSPTGSVAHSPRKIVNNRQDVSAHWSLRSPPRRSLNVSAPLTRKRSANQCPRKFAAPSVLPMKCAMMFLRRFAPTNQPQLPSLLMTSSVPMSPLGSVRLPPDKSATMLWSRFQGRLLRLNVRLSLFKSVQEARRNPVADLVALDMETRLFSRNYVKCM